MRFTVYRLGKAALRVDCSQLSLSLGFMANGEVQIFLNFSLHDSMVFAILRALSGEKAEAGNYERN